MEIDLGTQASRNSQQKEEMGNIFRETKEIMQLMDSSQSKIVSLEEVLKEKMNLFETLQNNLYFLKDSHCKNYVHLETYEKMRMLIKEKHRNGLESAKILYNSCQELSNLLDNSKTECRANEELILKTQEKIKIEQTKFDQKEIKISEEIQTINNDLEKEHSLKNDEREYNARLKKELDNLQMEIEECENSQRMKENYLTEEETNEENKEQTIIEKFIIVNKEFDVATEYHEQLKTSHLQEINELESQLTSKGEQFSLKKNELLKKNTEIQSLTEELNNIQNQNTSVNELIERTKSEFNNCLREIEYINNKIKTDDQKHKENISTYNEKICEREQSLSQKKEDKHNISEALLSTSCRIEILSKEISDITNYLNVTKQSLTDDLDDQVFKTEYDLQEIKFDLKKMKLELKDKTKQMQVRIQQVESEIMQIDANIKQRQDAISDLENKTVENEEKKVDFERLIEKNKQILSDFELERTQLKSKAFDRQKDKLSVLKSIPKKKTRLELLPKKSNWDSDSSMEGVDKTASMQLARNIDKMMAGKSK